MQFKPEVVCDQSRGRDTNFTNERPAPPPCPNPKSSYDATPNKKNLPAFDI